MRSRIWLVVFCFVLNANAYKLKNSFEQAFISDGEKLTLGDSNMKAGSVVTYTGEKKKIGKSEYLGFKKSGDSKIYFISQKIFLKSEGLNNPPGPRNSPDPAPKPKPSPKPDPAPKPRSNDEKKCENGKVPITLDYFYGKTCAMQADGSCVGQTGARVIDAAKVRYREKYPNVELSKMQILAEPLYYRNQQEYLFGGGDLSNEQAEDLLQRIQNLNQESARFTDGAYPNDYFPKLIRTLQNKSIDTTNPDPNKIPVVRDSSEMRKIWQEYSTELNKNIANIVAQWGPVKNIQDVKKFMNTALPIDPSANSKKPKRMRDRVAWLVKSAVNNFMNDSRVQKDKGVMDKRFASDLFFQPLFDGSEGSCNPEMLRRTVLYFLCREIPLVGWGNFTAVQKGGSHAMTVVGYVPPDPKNKGALGSIKFRNSWGDIMTSPTESFSKMCNSSELEGLSYLGVRGDPPPASLPKNIYAGRALSRASKAARVALGVH